MNDGLLSLFQADDLPLAELLHQRLEAAGIDAFVEPTASPLDGLTAMNQGTEVMVRSGDMNAARTILDAFLAEHAD